MSWLKRNLFFVIGSVVALALMGLAGWFLYSKLTLNGEILGNLTTDNQELTRLNNEHPHPGNNKIDNIKAAKDQRKQALDFVEKARVHFQPIPRIPDLPKVTDHDFFSALSSTVDQLQRTATNASVALPPSYYFSFQGESSKVSFAPAGLNPLATQLGEVKALCDILIQAKVNSIDNIRRCRVAAEDANGLLTDYLAEKSVTNDLVVLTPYEIVFRAFSSELAAVMTSLTASPQCFIIKTINVEPAPASAAQPESTSTTPAYVYNPSAYQSSAEPPPMSTAQIYAQRYGIRRGAGGEGGANMGGIQYRPLGSQPAYTPPPVAPTAQPGTAPAGSKGGLQTVLDEKQLKITINLLIVKLLPPKKAE